MQALHEDGGLPVPSLYVQIPFCPFRCAYCDFDFTVRLGGIDRYLKALEREAAVLEKTCRPGWIYLGGGTPSLLSEAEFERLAGMLSDRFRVSSGSVREWSIEANPETVTKGKAALWSALGVNRVSIGAQTFSDEGLRVLGRKASARDIFRAFEILRSAGFSNLNLDLIFGIPGGKLEDWRSDLEQALSLEPEHLSAYSLTFEEKTPLGLAHARGRIAPVPDETSAMLYRTAVEFLAGRGFARYEVSNFARPGFECRHNLHTWRHGRYLGLGSSAASFVGRTRGANLRGEARYAERMNRSGSAFEIHKRFSDAEAAREKLLLGLRLAEGVSWRDDSSAGSGPDGCVAPAEAVELERLVSEGLLIRRGGRVVPTDRGFLFADEISSALV